MLDLDHLTAAMRHGISVDTALGDQLAASIRAVARRWYLTPPGVLLAPTREQLTTANNLRIGARQPTARRRLARLTGDVAALAGWLAWLSGNYEAAHAYYTFSYSLASEEQDHDARAFVLVARSFLHSSLFQPEMVDGSLSRTLLDEAVAVTERSSSPYLRIFALGRRAEELAMADGVSAAGALRDLDRAETILTTAANADDGFFSYVDENRLMGCRGTCAVLKRRPKEAISALSPVLATARSELKDERSVLLADLAAAYAMQGEPEIACLLLSRSISGTDGHANRIGRARAVRTTHLSAWSATSAVRDLDDQLRAAGV